MLHPHACPNDLKTVGTTMCSFPMLGLLVGDQEIKTRHVYSGCKYNQHANKHKNNNAFAVHNASFSMFKNMSQSPFYYSISALYHFKLNDQIVCTTQ